jgi:hypothetical protein
MTEFMHRLDEVLGGVRSAVRIPELVESSYLKTGEGVHEQVETRAYAEQLVSEANAVLSTAGQTRLSLEDLSGTLDQVFVIRCGAAWAQLATRFQSRGSYAEVLGSSLKGLRQKLIDSGALEDLLVSLVIEEASDQPVERNR